MMPHKILKPNVNNGKIIRFPLILSYYTIYSQLPLLMCDLHMKNKLLVCFQAIRKSLVCALFSSFS